MRLSNRFISILQKLLLILTAVIFIITFLELTFIGKNITFSTRFTPPSSQQNHLRNQTYITEAQALIILLCILYVFFLPTTIYSAYKKSKRIFLPLLLATNIISGLLVFLNIYFLTGASQYRNFMAQQYHNFIQKSGLCDGNSTLCIVGTCVRLEVFQEAKSMSIAFTVINSIFSLILTVISILCNKRRKDSTKLQLIV